MLVIHEDNVSENIENYLVIETPLQLRNKYCQHQQSQMQVTQVMLDMSVT
jgi:hypothetical protein